MVFIKAYLQGRADEPDYLIKCLIEHLENNIKKAIGDEPLDADLISGKKELNERPKERNRLLVVLTQKKPLGLKEEFKGEGNGKFVEIKHLEQLPQN